MSNGVLSLLLGLGGGYLQGSQQRQQQRRQDEQEQQRKQLQDLQIQDYQRRAQQAQMAPYLSDLDHAAARFSQNPDALAQIGQRKAGLLNGGMQVTGVDAPRQGPDFAAGDGPLAVKPRTLASTLSGLNLGQSDQQRSAEAAQRNAVTGKLFADTNDFEHPEAIAQAITQLNSGFKLGSAIPGRVVTEQKDLPADATSVGFEGNIPPRLPPNTVDLAQVYKDAGRTKAQLQADERAKLEMQREQGRLNLEVLRANPKMARTEAEFREKVGRVYGQMGGSPEYRDAFIESEVANWKKSAGLTPATPGAPTITAPTGAQAFPNGTTAQAGIGQKNAQAGLANAKTGDVEANAEDRRSRTQAYVDSVKNTKDYRSKVLTLRQADQDIRKDLGNRRIDVQQAAQAWRQVVDSHKDALRQWEEENAAALKGPKADPVLTQRATLLRQRIGRLEGQINRLQVAGNDAAAKNLYPNLDNLNREFNSLVGGAKQPVPSLTPRPTLPDGSGVPALPRATPQNLAQPGGADHQRRVNYRNGLIQRGLKPADVNRIMELKFGAP